MDSFVVGDLGEVENVGEYIEEEASSVLLEDGYTFVPTTPPSEDHMLARQPSSNSQLFQGPTKGVYKVLYNFIFFHTPIFLKS